LINVKEQKENIVALAKDFPRLWNSSSSTLSKDRKRILRLLIKDITVEKLKEENKVKAILHIRWQGGALEDIEVSMPQKCSDKWRHSPEIIERIRELALTMTDKQIVEKFNQEDLKTNKGNPFTLRSIGWIRFKHKIPSPVLQGFNELSINQVAEKFNVSHYVVRYWIERSMINARRIGPKLWISIDPEKEVELKSRVENSTRISIVRSKSQTETVRVHYEVTVGILRVLVFPFPLSIFFSRNRVGK